MSFKDKIKEPFKWVGDKAKKARDFPEYDKLLRRGGLFKDSKILRFRDSAETAVDYATQGEIPFAVTGKQRIEKERLDFLRKLIIEKKKEIKENLDQLSTYKRKFIKNKVEARDIPKARNLVNKTLDLIQGNGGLIELQSKYYELTGNEIRTPRHYVEKIIRHLLEYQRVLENARKMRGEESVDFVKKNFSSFKKMKISGDEFKKIRLDIEKRRIEENFEKKRNEIIKKYEEDARKKAENYEKELIEAGYDPNQAMMLAGQYFNNMISNAKDQINAEIAKTAEEFNSELKEAAEKIEAQHEWGVSGGGFTQYVKDAMPGRDDLFRRGRRQYLGRGHSIEPMIFGALVTGVIGIILGAIFGSAVLVIAFMSLAFSMILPGASKEKTKNANGNEIEVWRGRGTSTMKAFAEATALIFGLYFLYTSNFPLSAFIMIIIAFAAYGAFPVTFEKERTDEFIKSFIRMFLGVVVISIWLFGNMFQSSVLMWMGILFLAVPPLRRSEQSDSIRAGGEDMFYRILFLIGMGWIFYGVVGSGGWGLTGASLYTFYLIWGMSFVSGLFSAVEDVPKIGSILLIVALILFGTTGTGEENIGMAMFGQWWPTVHNSITNNLQPLADAFQGFGNTFGQGWLMMTDPMGFANQIMDGNYAKNPTGATGAYGLEIRNFVVDTIYPDEIFTVRFELFNMGPKDAKAVNLTITSSIGGFDLNMMNDDSQKNEENFSEGRKDRKYDIGMGTVIWKAAINIPGGIVGLNHRGPIEQENLESNEDIRTRNYWTFVSDQRKVQRADIIPIFMTGKIDCISARNALWRSYTMPSSVVGLGDNIAVDIAEHFVPGKNPELSDSMKQRSRLGSGNPDALKYITFRAIEEYGYSTDSALQIKFISHDRWQELTRDNKFSRASVPSTMTSGPIKLNLGTMDQPIPSGNPFYIGFNVTTPKPRTTISDVIVDLTLPEGIDHSKMKCTKGYQKISVTSGNETVLTWDLKNGPSYSVMCNFQGNTVDMSGLEKTFTVTANATYTVTSYEDYNTQTAFKSTCFTKGIATVQNSVAVLGNVLVMHAYPSNNNIRALIQVPFTDENKGAEIKSASCSNKNVQCNKYDGAEKTIEVTWNNIEQCSNVGETKSGIANIMLETEGIDGINEFYLDAVFNAECEKDENNNFILGSVDVYLKEIRTKQNKEGIESAKGIDLITIENQKPEINDEVSDLESNVISADVVIDFEDDSTKIKNVECPSKNINCDKKEKGFSVSWANVKLSPVSQVTDSDKVTVTVNEGKYEKKYEFMVVYQVSVSGSNEKYKISDISVYVDNVKIIQDYSVNLIPDEDKTKIKIGKKEENIHYYDVTLGFSERDDYKDDLSIEIKNLNDFSCKIDEDECKIKYIVGKGQNYIGYPKFSLFIDNLKLNSDINEYTLSIKGKYKNQKTGKDENFMANYDIKIDSNDPLKSTIKPVS